MTGEVWIAGHSLGAADAALYAYSRVQRGLRVDGLYLFACPRPGDGMLGANLRRAGVKILSVKNDWDGVTDVPFDAHAASEGWDYEDVNPWTMIHEAPSFVDFLADPFFAHHHIAHYQAGVHKLPALFMDDATFLAKSDALIAAAVASGGASVVPANGWTVGINEAVDEVARLYETADGWNWINPVDGLYWAMRAFPNGARLMIRRGSKTGRDWFTEDFRFDQHDWYGARASVGFCDGIKPVQDKLDSALA